MRGYLERLAASASRPQSRLRPVAGSIFANDKREEIGEGALPAVPEHASEAITTRPTLQSERSLPAQEPAIRPNEHPGRPQQVREKPPAFSPLLPPKILEVDPAMLQVRQAATGAPVQPHLQSQPAARIEPTQHRLEMPLQKRENTPEPPLLPQRAIKKRNDERNSEAGETGQEPAQAVEPLIKPVTRTARSEAREILPASETRERSETEEIQIHIGRIEVIAVPPPGVRSAAPPANRFTSLDDYLKRRDGRAR